MKDYQKSFAVSKPAVDVYAAITTHIANWWSNDLSGEAVFAGDTFHIAFGKTRKTFSIEEAITNRKLIWKCKKAYIDMASLKDKSEWEGTRIIWTLSPIGESTKLDFLHEGLNQSFECYQVCEQGWDMFLKSLEVYLNTGKGSPYLKKTENA